ncbi:MAG: hypothetical protein B7Z26_11005, partial [Asticcacaulis sp. 32-58-5]
PNLRKNQLDKLVQYKNVRAGYRSEGVPSNIDIVRSLRGSLARGAQPGAFAHHGGGFGCWPADCLHGD